MIISNSIHFLTNDITLLFSLVEYNSTLLISGIFFDGHLAVSRSWLLGPVCRYFCGMLNEIPFLSVVRLPTAILS